MVSPQPVALHMSEELRGQTAGAFSVARRGAIVTHDVAAPCGYAHTFQTITIWRWDYSSHIWYLIQYLFFCLYFAECVNNCNFLVKLLGVFF